MELTVEDDDNLEVVVDLTVGDVDFLDELDVDVVLDVVEFLDEVDVDVLFDLDDVLSGTVSLIVVFVDEGDLDEDVELVFEDALGVWVDLVDDELVCEEDVVLVLEELVWKDGVVVVSFCVVLFLDDDEPDVEDFVVLIIIPLIDVLVFDVVVALVLDVDVLLTDGLVFDVAIALVLDVDVPDVDFEELVVVVTSPSPSLSSP